MRISLNEFEQVSLPLLEHSMQFPRSRPSGAIDRSKLEPQGWSSVFSRVQFLASDNQLYRVDPRVDITVRPMALVERIDGVD